MNAASRAATSRTVRPSYQRTFARAYSLSGRNFAFASAEIALARTGRRNAFAQTACPSSDTRAPYWASAVRAAAKWLIRSAAIAYASRAVGSIG